MPADALMPRLLNLTRNESLRTGAAGAQACFANRVFLRLPRSRHLRIFLDP